MIPPDFIQTLRERADIVDIVGSRVNLVKKGKDHWGLCPFHDEKTASFKVSADKQFYYCFGCQASGSALDFLQTYDGLDFVSAVETLASRLGLEVPQVKGDREEDTRRREERDRLSNVTRLASEFYQRQLRSHPDKERVISYLKGRGLTGEIAREYALGFAPGGWDNLMTALADDTADEDVITAGLIVDRPEEKKRYDRFRDRVMFPIRDIRGRTIAFGGRVISDDDKPKYLNSPETPIFHKGRELYGLFEAKRSNRQLESLIVVEGYMDVVALARHGIGNAVATLGTASTQDHVQRLFRTVNTIIFCFDGDRAGRNAAWKALLNCLPQMGDGRNVRFEFLPDGEDPDSMVRKEGKDRFELRLERAQLLSEFMFGRLSETIDVQSIDGRAQLAKEGMVLLMQMPDTMFRALMIESLSEKTGLSTDKLQQVSGMTRAPALEVPPWDEYDIPPDLDEEDEGVVRDRGRERLAREALHVLMHTTEVVSTIDTDEVERLAGIPECHLLLEVIRVAVQEPNLSPVMLLSRFRMHSDGALLTELAEAEQLLAVPRLPSHFKGVIDRLMGELDKLKKQEGTRSLSGKSLAELTEDEKARLRALHRPPG